MDLPQRQLKQWDRQKHVAKRREGKMKGKCYPFNGVKSGNILNTNIGRERQKQRGV